MLEMINVIVLACTVHQDVLPSVARRLEQECFDKTVLCMDPPITKSGIFYDPWTPDNLVRCLRGRR